MFKKNALIAFLLLAVFSVQAQTKEEFIAFLEQMKATLGESKSQGWQSVDKSSILDSVYFSPTATEEAKQRAANFSNSLYFSPNRNELYTYSDYPFGKYYYDSMLVTLEDGQQFYTSINDGGHFSEGSMNFDPDTLKSVVQSVIGKVRYWFPDRIKVFAFGTDEIGKKSWKDGIYAELVELEDNYLKVNIGPGDSLTYDKYYSTGYLEMRVYALNDQGEELSTIFGTSLHSMEGLSELLDLTIEKGKGESLDGEQLSKYMSGLTENEFAHPGVSYAESVEGKIDQVMVVVRLENDWDFVEDSVKIMPETVASEGWKHENDLTLNSDQVHVNFNELTADELIAQSTIKVSNYYNEYLDIHQPKIDLRLPWSHNEISTGYDELDVELTNVEFYKNKKRLEGSTRFSGVDTQVYHGFFGTLENEKAIANRVKGEYVFDYATKVNFKPLAASQYEIGKGSVVSISFDSLGYESHRDFKNHTAGQKVWAKNKAGDWLLMIDDDFYLSEKPNSINYCFAGKVAEVYIAEIPEGKENIRIPFNMEIEEPE
ncbi:MAG: hypothetical protein ABJO02_04540 [Reichenbachiella sp.]|uniref:hypothetical protein n=1 Tax=Reichenbachiella sp. TaxID=2184521 RepID=UPI00329959D0